MEELKIIIVEDVPLELRDIEDIFKDEVPEAEIIGTTEDEQEHWRLIKQQVPDLVLLDLGFGDSTTAGVEICRQAKQSCPQVKVLIFASKILNEKSWVDMLDTSCDRVVLKNGRLLTRGDVGNVMAGKRMVFSQPTLKKIVERFKLSIHDQLMRQEVLVNYEIDEYDGRLLHHLALGCTKEQTTNLRGVLFGVKGSEKRQNELTQKFFPDGSNGTGINVTRLVVRATELRVLDVDNLQAGEE